HRTCPENPITSILTVRRIISLIRRVSAYNQAKISIMNQSLEQALSALESQLAVAVKAARSALAELKKAQTSARVGQIRDLSKGLAEGRNAAKRFADEMASADSSW